MNKILKVVFSRSKGMFVVVSELGRACTKGSLKSVLVAVPIALAPPSVLAVGEFQTGQLGIAITRDGSGLAQAKDNAAIAVGIGAVADEEANIAIGSQYKKDSTTVDAASATGQGAIAIGADSDATNDYAIALGHGSEASARNSIALGLNAQANTTDATAIGNSAFALSDSS